MGRTQKEYDINGALADAFALIEIKGDEVGDIVISSFMLSMFEKEDNVYPKGKLSDTWWGARFWVNDKASDEQFWVYADTADDKLKFSKEFPAFMKK